MTRAELETAIGRLLGDPDHTQFTTSVIDDELNKSQERIVLETRCLTDKQTITIVSGTQEYDLPTDFLVSTRVTHKNIKLDPTSKNVLDFYSGEDWTDNEGTPTEYYIDMRDPDSKKIGFYPIPQSGDAGANLINEYIVDPADLSSSTSVPFNSHALLAPYHYVLVHDVVQTLKQQEPMSPESTQKIQFHQLERDKIMRKIIDTFKNTANKPLRMRGGRKWKY